MPGKIMHVIGQISRGGAERQLLLVAEALAQRGWSQSVIIFNSGDAWEDRFAAFGVPIYVIPRHPIKLWRLLQLSCLSFRQHPDIIHSWSGHTNVYAMLTISPSRSKRVLSFRGNPKIDNRTGQPLEALPNAAIYRHADCIVSNSRAALTNVENVIGARTKSSGWQYYCRSRSCETGRSSGSTPVNCSRRPQTTKSIRCSSARTGNTEGRRLGV